MDKHVLLGTNGPLKDTNDPLLHNHVLDPDLGCQLNRVLLYHTSTCNRLLLQSPNAPEHTLSHAPTLTRSAVIQYIVIFPTQNGFIESFNGRFRDECLNEHWFRDLAHAREVIGNWRRDYNENRPHSALSYQTPLEFAAGYRTTEKGSKLTDITK